MIEENDDKYLFKTINQCDIKVFIYIFIFIQYLFRCLYLKVLLVEHYQQD